MLPVLSHGDAPVPAPASWRNLTPTDAPVLRNALWHAQRSIERGLWSIAIYGDAHALQLVAMQDYVVDDHGGLVPLTEQGQRQSVAWHASAYTIDQAACEWMDRLHDVPQAGSALHAMACQARSAAPAAPAVAAQVLPQPLSTWYAASVRVADDLAWKAGEPLISVDVEDDERERLVLTSRQARALGAVLLSLVLTACGGGGDDPDTGIPRVNCAAEVCR